LYEAGHINHIVTDSLNDISRLGPAKSLLREKADKHWFDKVSAPVSKFTKELAATEDSALYNMMQQTVMLSDLGFKYAYYQNQRAKGVSKQEALTEVSHVFLNYDATSSRGVDYLEVNGFAMFIKFKMRFARAILSKLTKSPTRAILVDSFADALSPTNNILDAAPVIGDTPSLLTNPLSSIATPFTETPLGKILDSLNPNG
jgi:hypothetical protein